MPEIQKFNPTPYQSLTNAGLSTEQARQALIALVENGYAVGDSPEPRRTFLADVTLHIPAHSTAHASTILEGFTDGPAALVQDDLRLELSWINVDQVGEDDLQELTSISSGEQIALGVPETDATIT